MPSDDNFQEKIVQMKYKYTKYFTIKFNKLFEQKFYFLTAASELQIS